jgi:hypothetical protein
MVRAEVKIDAPQNFFQTLSQNLRPPPLKYGAPFSTFFWGETVVFWSNLRPSYYPITSRGPSGPRPPPLLATALNVIMVYFMFYLLFNVIKLIQIARVQKNFQ